MKALLPCLIFTALFPLVQAGAVENVSNGTYNIAAPTNTDILGWTTGWGANGVTGWNYVGTVNGGPANNGASGVYLGNGWVLTAAHVGSGTFTLGGADYSVVSTAAPISNVNGTADLTLFQIAPITAPLPNLPALSIATSAPSPSVSSVAMIGYGGGSESWGLNTVTGKDLLVTPSGYSYISSDFATNYGAQDAATNNYEVVLGDSGGGDFIYNSSKGIWQLAGVNEAHDASNNSYMIQLSTYASQINPIVAAPEPSPGLFFAFGLLAIFGFSRSVPGRKERRYSRAGFGGGRIDPEA